MKKLLSLLSVLTIAGTTMPNVIAASNYEKQENKEINNNDLKIDFKLIENIIKKIFYDAQNGNDDAENVLFSIENYMNNLPELMNDKEIIDYFKSAINSKTSATSEIFKEEKEIIGNTILSVPLWAMIKNLGISLAIGAVIYGCYYTYEHLDDIKNFTSESLKTLANEIYELINLSILDSDKFDYYDY